MKPVADHMKRYYTQPVYFFSADCHERGLEAVRFNKTVNNVTDGLVIKARLKNVGYREVFMSQVGTNTKEF